MSINDLVKKVNANLKPYKISVQINALSLCIQATLPPKPVAGEVLDSLQRATLPRKQQKISPGLKADIDGVKLAGRCPFNR